MAADATLETSIIIPIAAAMADVEPWRERLDPFSAYGMPAHVTVEYPFVPVDELDDAITASLRAIFAAVEPFAFELTELRWFDRRVLWLAPEPDDPFRELTAAVIERWPHLRPYGGPPGVVPPHLTVGVGERPEVGEAELLAAEAALEPVLPITARADEAWLMSGQRRPGTWRVLERVPLRGAAIGS